eukprot:CAMPEP_0204611194 /NCGR_PEP_ID=MMETSP0661-20131031/61897_1 /ASSEMBLY_ACC=CAM_ASM_000606 /TAXON_ID=109239 /ORGANISM="Alexandrium margalefi, Strain AMGDE01CS-322" /LENGTH=52 /DNA_ID=CAMNT_0051623037 /DNA_START=1039 /DNA_END=1200 /DNA_ORIENTATION=+
MAPKTSNFAKKCPVISFAAPLRVTCWQPVKYHVPSLEVPAGTTHVADMLLFR